MRSDRFKTSEPETQHKLVTVFKILELNIDMLLNRMKNGSFQITESEFEVIRVKCCMDTSLDSFLIVQNSKKSKEELIKQHYIEILSGRGDSSLKEKSERNTNESELEEVPQNQSLIAKKIRIVKEGSINHLRAQMHKRKMMIAGQMIHLDQRLKDLG